MHAFIAKLLNKRPGYIYQDRFESKEEAIKHSKNLQNYGSKVYDSRAIKKLKFEERHTQGRNMIVPLTLSVLGKDKCTILDVGGGVNAIFSHLSPIQKQQCQCFVLERPEIVKRLNDKIPTEYKHNLHYIDSIDGIESIDIAYFGSSVQYIDNHETLLEKISKRSAEFVIFSESIFTSNHKDYFVLQVNMFPDVFPNQFLSEQKLTKLMSTAHYQCTYNKAVAGDFSHKTIKRDSYDCKTLVFKRI